MPIAAAHSHAWLIGELPASAKATLAYRMGASARPSRFLFAGGATRQSLFVDPAGPVARHVAAGAHGGLLTLERTVNDKGVLRTVNHGRRDPRGRSRSSARTAAVEGWRVCIVDTVEDLNPNAPTRCSRCWKSRRGNRCSCWSATRRRGCCRTILSRCRKLPLRQLTTDDVIHAAAQATGIAPDDPALAEAADAAEGSVARALTLLGGDALKLQQRTANLLKNLPRVDPRELHALGEALPLSDRVALSASSTASSAGSASGCARTIPTPTLPALHGWRRCGKRSAAPRATPQIQSRAKAAGFLVFGMLAEAVR